MLNDSWVYSVIDTYETSRVCNDSNKAVSGWKRQAEHLDMYLENCIQREVVLLLISDNTTD